MAIDNSPWSKMRIFNTSQMKWGMAVGALNTKQCYCKYTFTIWIVCATVHLSLCSVTWDSPLLGGHSMPDAGQLSLSLTSPTVLPHYHDVSKNVEK